MRNILGKYSNYQNVLFISLFFGIIYALISFVNHYMFRTYALDLGAYTNALYDYAHGQWNDSTVFKPVAENLLADHFDIYLMLFSPLSFIFGTYTLLVVQILAVLFGGYGVYVFFKASNKSSVAIFATIYFYLFFGVFSALSFDYHSNVVAATLVPWLFYAVHQKRLWLATFLMLCIIIAKENMSLWLAFILLGMTIEYYKEVWLRYYLLIASVVSFACFFIIISVVMPAFSNAGVYPHFHYSALGNNFSEALVFLLSHPLDSFKILFTNHIQSVNGDYVKLELHVLLVVSGLLFLLRKPQYLVMLIPIYFQKLFHDNVAMWGVANQYSIEFAPILAIGIFKVLSDFKHTKWIKPIAVVVLLLTLGATLKIMDNSVIWFDKKRIRFYQAQHYQQVYDVKSVHKLLSSIPKEAVVSTQTVFLPHLSLRDKVYQFPIIKDATYIVYTEQENTYPLTKKAFQAKIQAIEASGQWDVVHKGSINILLKRDTKSGDKR